MQGWCSGAGNGGVDGGRYLPPESVLSDFYHGKTS